MLILLTLLFSHPEEYHHTLPCSSKLSHVADSLLFLDIHAIHSLFYNYNSAVAAADFRVIGWIQQICYTVKGAYYQICFIYRNSLQPYCIYTFIDNSFISKIYRISFVVCIQSSIFYTNLRFFVDQTFEEKHKMNE